MTINIDMLYSLLLNMANMLIDNKCVLQEKIDFIYIKETLSYIITNDTDNTTFHKNYQSNAKWGTYLRHLKLIYKKLFGIPTNGKLYSYLNNEESLTGAIAYSQNINNELSKIIHT